MTKNPYEILGVDVDATLEDIRKAYKSKAKKCHPDIAKDDGEAFKELVWAYDLLSNDNARAHYDQFGQDPNSSEAERTRSIMNSLCKIFDDISVNLSPEQLERYDLIGIMANAIKKKISDIENLVKDLEEARSRFDKLREVIESRMERKNKSKTPNFFLETLKKRISNIDSDLKSQDFMMDIAKGMLETVEEYDFKFDEENHDPLDTGYAQGKLRGIDGFGNWLTSGGFRG